MAFLYVNLILSTVLLHSLPKQYLIIYPRITPSMEIESISHNLLFKRLAQQNNVHILGCLINFIDLETLGNIVSVAIQAKKQQTIYKIAIAVYFLSKYFNRVDRSLFFLFYEEPEFKRIQKQTINRLAISQYHFLHSSYLSTRSILSQIQKFALFSQTPDEFSDLIENMFFEPDLPLPKLKRETIGMYCESPLQEMVSLIRFPIEITEEWLEPPLASLKLLLQKEVLNLTQNYGLFDVSKSIKERIFKVRYCPYEITDKNWQNYLIKDFSTHNLIVLLYALATTQVHTANTLISNITDPFMKLIEFSLRSNLYRNVVLAVEEKLGFVFKFYEKIIQFNFQHALQKPSANFWTGAMSIWVIETCHFHQIVFPVYNYVVAKLRENYLNDYLQNKIEKLPSLYTPLKYQMEMNTFSSKKKLQAYEVNEGNVDFEQFFENNWEMYEVLAKQFEEYMVDISINEFSVHWCGYSQHSISNNSLFNHYNKVILAQTLTYYSFLKEIIYEKTPQELRLGIYKEIVKEDLYFMSQHIAKPVTIRHISEFINKQISQEVHGMNQYAIFTEEGIHKYKITIDFNQKDHLIEYFAKKSQIQQNCPKEYQLFYDIQVKKEQNILQLIEGKQIEEESESEAEEKYESDEEMEQEKAKKYESEEEMEQEKP